MKLSHSIQTAKTMAACAIGLFVLVPGVAVGNSDGAVAAGAPQELASKLAVRAPKGIPSEIGNPTVAKGLGLAFNRDDLSALYSSKGFGKCQTSSIGVSPFSKNFSNFGADCFKALSDRFYLSNDVRLRKNGKSIGRPTYGWGPTEFNSLTTPAATRLVTRSASAAVGSNPVLRAVIEGRLDLSFSLGTFFGEGDSAPEQVERRPRYVLKVAQARGTESEGVRVAALDGAIGFGSSADTRQTAFEVGERSIVEEWDPPSSATLKPAKRSPKELSSGERLARRLGVAHVPFLKFGARLERRVTAQGDAIAARFAEANDIVYAELTNVAGGGVLAYGYRLPYQRHSLSMAYVETAPRAVMTYGYYVNDTNKAWLSYNANSEAYAAGFVRQL